MTTPARHRMDMVPNPTPVPDPRGLPSSGPGGLQSLHGLVEAACTTDHGLRVLRCGCDPLGTPRPLGPVRDLLADLHPLDGASPLAQVCEVAYAELRSEPSVLVVEDLHWVDAASVEVLRFLRRRLEAMPRAVVLTSRDEEVGEQHAVRPLLGDLEAAPGEEVERLYAEDLGARGTSRTSPGSGPTPRRRSRSCPTSSG